jgi:hypothetical protein
MIHNTVVVSASPGDPVTEGISPELFVYSYVDGTNDVYQHVATPEDVSELPERDQVGWDLYGQFFRQRTANLIYSNITAAEEQASMIKFRLGQLAIDYDTERETYEVTTDYVYKSIDTEVTITLRQVGHQESAESYSNTSTHHVAPVGITPYLFVHRYVGIGDPATYTRVATVNDILTLPTSTTTPNAYYRAQSAVLLNPTLAGIIQLAATIRQSLSVLAQDYREYEHAYSGDETVVYDA